MPDKRINNAFRANRNPNDPFDGIDNFPTPPWATRAIAETILELHKTYDFLPDFFSTLMSDENRRGERQLGQRVWEPSCGAGHMARVLGEYYAHVRASDIHDYGYGEVGDFFALRGDGKKCDIWANPPFSVGDDFVRHAIKQAHGGMVVIFQRLAFLESQGRYETLFKPHPPAFVLPFVERVGIVRGRVDKNAKTQASYAAFVWLANGGFTDDDSAVRFIKKCRKRLEREGDYDNAISSEVPPRPTLLDGIKESES